jgi:hypothetical protein
VTHSTCPVRVCMCVCVRVLVCVCVCARARACVRTCERAASARCACTVVTVAYVRGWALMRMCAR